jgi:hypothetical protein
MVEKIRAGKMAGRKIGGKMGLCRVRVESTQQNAPLLFVWTSHVTKVCAGKLVCAGIFVGCRNEVADRALFSLLCVCYGHTTKAGRHNCSVRSRQPTTTCLGRCSGLFL